jgi:DNA-binding cell septation regulator SpoVG
MLADVCLTLNSCICVEGIRLVQGKNKVYLKWPGIKIKANTRSGINIISNLFKGQVQSLIWSEYCRKAKRGVRKVGQFI